MEEKNIGIGEPTSDQGKGLNGTYQKLFKGEDTCDYYSRAPSTRRGSLLTTTGSETSWSLSNFLERAFNLLKELV